ncbi:MULTISPECIES: phosphate ABC transporter permease PstA [Brachymonas]|uniref:phosphate ABC transporter permease PstA n=1 Tax=Brachymonas TaxID=28219 RepID=UPI002E777474|nr:phosphate ABC transporter permease PstA [Brachymonas sp. J145]MEE1652778.1 phosphate ABC transporter permease PstA [Brachymonas sp. J145]
MSATATANQHDYRLAKFNKRKLVNTIALTMSFLAMCSGIVWLFWILWDTFMLGIQGLGVHVFTESMPAPNEVGGIGNAIVGSLMMVAVATVIGTPIGIMAGIYLAEYDKSSWLAKTTRFVNDVLLSAPSIVIGIFVAAMLVAPMKTFSGWAGAVALALIVIPVVIRTTENMLNLIPASMREAAYALGTPKWRVVKDITLKSAMAGVVTGVLLAVARIAGETAPLLFTSLSNQFWSTDMSSPMASLPVMIYNFAMSPYGNWQELAWVGVFVITVTVLAINILARLLTRKS